MSLPDKEISLSQLAQNFLSLSTGNPMSLEPFSPQPTGGNWSPCCLRGQYVQLIVSEKQMTHLFWHESYLWHQTEVGLNPLSITYHLDETLDTCLNFSEAKILVYKSQ